MTEKPFSMEPDEEFSQPVERLGATASDAAHLDAFGRPQAEEALSTAAAERSGWIPATPMGGQRVEPVLPVYSHGSGGAVSSSAPETRVFDMPVIEAEPSAPEAHDAEPVPFTYSLGDEGQVAGDGADSLQSTIFAGDPSGLLIEEAEPFTFPDDEAPVNPDDEGHESLVAPEGPAQYGEHEFYKGSPIKDFLIKYNSFILYGGGGIAALVLGYGLFFSGGGHHQQQASVIAADAVRQAQFVQHESSSQDQPTSQPIFPSSGIVAAPGEQAAQNGAPQVIFNPSSAVQPAPPPAPPSKALPAQPQPPAPVAAAPTAAGPIPAQAAPPGPSDTAQLSAVTSRLQQLSTSVSSIGSKVSDSQSNMASTISQMDDKISNLQAIVLQLEMKVAVASSLPAQTAPAAASASPPPSPAAPAPAAPPATPLKASQVASLPVLRGYSLQGYSQGAVVVGTTMGEVTVKINDTVPGAGTAEGLYRFDASAGQYGIELVTDQGVIRPTAKSPY
jgi:hypothetical protein